MTILCKTRICLSLYFAHFSYLQHKENGYILSESFVKMESITFMKTLQWHLYTRHTTTPKDTKDCGTVGWFNKTNQCNIAVLFCLWAGKLVITQLPSNYVGRGWHLPYKKSSHYKYKLYIFISSPLQDKNLRFKFMYWFKKI